MKRNISEIPRQRLCIGCGLCAAACPQEAIRLHWGRDRTWRPVVAQAACESCGLCYQACPNTPERLCEYASAAAQVGERFGLPQAAEYFVGYDQDQAARQRSASGGAVTRLLAALLAAGEIEGVIGAVPLWAGVGQPHHELRLLRTPQELEGARSSCYHPLRYDRVLGEASGRLALVGVPCVLRGVRRLPAALTGPLRYLVGLSCSHNVTGAFVDCLGVQVGVGRGEEFTANLRDKQGGIPDANNFNNHFRLRDREIRRNRFETAFTVMWRSHFFAQECCLYCPDFYARDADLSVKDAWGPLSKDPLGISLLVVRNPALAAALRSLGEAGALHLEPCTAGDVFHSQAETAVYKHRQVRDRLWQHPALRRQLEQGDYPLLGRRQAAAGVLGEYRRCRRLLRGSRLLYAWAGQAPVKAMVGAIKRKERQG